MNTRKMIWATATIYIMVSWRFTLIECYDTPYPMVGLCNGSCTPNGAFPCVYTPYYPVSFTDDGHWSWNAPFEDNSKDNEIGVGLMLGRPYTQYHLSDPDPWWSSMWYGGNQIVSDPQKTIHCGCYYLYGHEREDSWVFHNYLSKERKGVFDKSVEEVCGTTLSCPFEEEEARAIYGDPFIETYYGWCEYNISF